jgi:Skp family chaperone for outer membrane proteins
MLAGQLCAVEKEGIVNFVNCVTDTKLGKQEQATLETMRKQFVTLMEDTEKQLKEISEKMQDKDYLDGLSPDAEQKMKEKFGQLSEEYSRYQQQYYQFVNQGQMKVGQAVFASINKAAEKIAASKGYTKIANKDMYFYYAPSLDITADVIKEMDKTFEEEVKKQAAAAPAVKEEAKPTVAAPAAKEEAKPTAAKEEAKKPTAAAPAVKEEAKKPAAKAEVKAEEKKNAPEAAKSR